MTVRELAAIAGISHSVIVEAEAGRLPELVTIERLASSLGINACWLAYGDEGSAPFTQKVPGGAASSMPEPGEPIPPPDPQACAGLAERLRQAREARGLSRKALGRATQISGTAIQNIESGRSMPAPDTTEMLALALEVAPCWLAFGEGSGVDG
jgi:transcriptional regulator with XRE-family HTH domain